MGERFQIHTIIEFKTRSGREVELNSTHLQWCWDVHIVRNLYRLMHTFENTVELTSWDEVDNYIKGILTVNQNLEGGYYNYRAHVENPYLTDEGDSDRGWAVLKIKVNQDGKVCDVRSCFYDVEGVKRTKKELWAGCVKAFSYYNLEKWEQDKVKAMLDSGLFCNTKVDLQEVFNKMVKAIREKEKKKANN